MTKRTAATLLSVGLWTLPASAVGDIDQNYIRSLAAPGKTVLVIEYYDGGGKVGERKGYASATGFKAAAPTDIRVDDKTVLHLYGLEPCQGEMVNRSEDFAGSCADFAQQQLAIMLQSPFVVFRRGLRMAKWVWVPPLIDYKRTIDQIIVWSQISRREGLLALENQIARHPDPFVKRSLQMLVDGADPDRLR